MPRLVLAPGEGKFLLGLCIAVCGACCFDIFGEILSDSLRASKVDLGKTQGLWFLGIPVAAVTALLTKVMAIWTVRDRTRNKRPSGR